jgi:hypothetical protein
MAKQGQHEHDQHDPRVSRGHNNPDKSVEITTGNYKKPETHQKQAQQHKDTDAVPQHDENEWQDDTRLPFAEGTSRHKDSVAKNSRTGTDSNASK